MLETLLSNLSSPEQHQTHNSKIDCPAPSKAPEMIFPLITCIWITGYCNAFFLPLFLLWQPQSGEITLAANTTKYSEMLRGISGRVCWRVFSSLLLFPLASTFLFREEAERWKAPFHLDNLSCLIWNCPECFHPVDQNCLALSYSTEIYIYIYYFFFLHFVHVSSSTATRSNWGKHQDDVTPTENCILVEKAIFSPLSGSLNLKDYWVALPLVSVFPFREAPVHI